MSSTSFGEKHKTTEVANLHAVHQACYTLESRQILLLFGSFTRSTLPSWFMHAFKQVVKQCISRFPMVSGNNATIIALSLVDQIIVWKASVSWYSYN